MHWFKPIRSNMPKEARFRPDCGIELLPNRRRIMPCYEESAPRSRAWVESHPHPIKIPHWSISGLILGGLCVCASEWVIAYSVTGGHPAKLIPTFFIVMFLLLVIVRFTNVTDKHFPEVPPSDSQPGMEASSSGQPPPTTRLLFTSSPFWDRVLLTVLGIVSFFLWSHSKGDVPRDIFGTLFPLSFVLAVLYPMFFLPIAPMSPEEKRRWHLKKQKKRLKRQKAKADKKRRCKS